MVRFLSCMDTLVTLQITRLIKGFSTLLTVVRFLSRMDTLVTLQITSLTKGFSTLLTVVRFSLLYGYAGDSSDYQID